jgi:hypothetical protein
MEQHKEPRAAYTNAPPSRNTNRRSFSLHFNMTRSEELQADKLDVHMDRNGMSPYEALGLLKAYVNRLEKKLSRKINKDMPKL